MTEPLEVRCLLAGNVAAVIANGNLTLQGDSEANSVAVLVENGDVIVRGLDDTTVNGGTNDFTAVAGSSAVADNLFARLGEGDDVFLLSGVSIGGRVMVSGSGGNDQIGIEGATVGKHLAVLSANGNNVVNVNNTNVSGRTLLVTGNGDDLVNVQNSSVSRINVHTRSGHDNIVLDTVQAGRNARIVSGGGNDTVAVSGSQFSRSVNVVGRRGADVIQIESTTVARRTVVRGGRGADSVRIGAATNLGRFVARTGSGQDSVEVDATATISRRRVRGAESATVDAELLETRFNDSTTGALTLSTNAQQFFDGLLGNTAPQVNPIQDVTVEENSPNTVIDLFAAFNDSQDADADLTLTIDSNTNAALFDSAAIDATSGQLTLDYATDATGAATMTVSATDTEGLSASSTFTVTVTATPNSFEIAESASVGEVLGQVVADAVEGNAVYQLEDTSVPAGLRLAPDDHIAGAAAGKVVLIEYLDFQCPSCRQFHPIVQQLQQDFANDLLVVSRHLPLSGIHANAEAAAIAAEAAGRQNMFDEMADALFTNQPEWSGVADPTSLFAGYAATLGLNAAQFASDVNDTALADRVQRDADAAATLGASSTPTFFLQGTTVTPAANQTAFGDIVSAAIVDFDNANVPFVVDHQTGDVVLASGTTLNSATTPQHTVNVRASGQNGSTEVIAVSIQVTNGT